MCTFSSLLTVDNVLYQFCFSEIARLESPKYYVAVKQEEKLVTAFEMKMDNYHNHWVVCQPAPDWVFHQVATLDEMIKSNL